LIDQDEEWLGKGGREMIDSFGIRMRVLGCVFAIRWEACF